MSVVGLFKQSRVQNSLRGQLQRCLQFKRCFADQKDYPIISLEYLKQCEEIAVNNLHGELRSYIINLKRDPQGLCFFKVVERSFGKRSNIFFDADKDVENIIKGLEIGKTSEKEKIFASFGSDTFKHLSWSMLKTRKDTLQITEEDLKSNKARRLFVEEMLIDRIIQCIKYQKEQI